MLQNSLKRNELLMNATILPIAITFPRALAGSMIPKRLTEISPVTEGSVNIRLSAILFTSRQLKVSHKMGIYMGRVPKTQEPRFHTNNRPCNILSKRMLYLV
jgi:hypothetical protein